MTIDQQEMKDSLRILVSDDNWLAEEELESSLLDLFQREANTPRFNAPDPAYAVAYYQGKVAAMLILQEERRKYLTSSAHKLNS